MAFVQSDVQSAASATTPSSPPTLSAVGAGNAVVVVVIQQSATNRTYTVVSDIDGALTAISGALIGFDGRRVQMWEIPGGASAGNHTFTVAASGSSSYNVAVIEWSGLDHAASPIKGTYNDGSTVTSHFCAESGDIDTAGPCAIIAAGVTTGSTMTTSTVGAGFTSVVNDTRGVIQYLDAASAVTDERGAWSGSPSRRCIGCIVAFPVASGGGGDPTPVEVSVAWRSVSTLDVGAVRQRPSAAACTSVGALHVAAVRARQVAAALQSVPSLTATPRRLRRVTAAWASVGAWTTVARRRRVAVAQWRAVAALSATSARLRMSAVSLRAVGALTAVPRRLRAVAVAWRSVGDWRVSLSETVSATLTAVGSWSVGVVRRRMASVSMRSTAALDVAPQRQRQASTSWSAATDLTATSRRVRGVTARWRGHSRMSAAVRRVRAVVVSWVSWGAWLIGDGFRPTNIVGVLLSGRFSRAPRREAATVAARDRPRVPGGE